MLTTETFSLTMKNFLLTKKIISLTMKTFFLAIKNIFMIMKNFLLTKEIVFLTMKKLLLMNLIFLLVNKIVSLTRCAFRKSYWNYYQQSISSYLLYKYNKKMRWLKPKFYCCSLTPRLIGGLRNAALSGALAPLIFFFPNAQQVSLVNLPLYRFYFIFEKSFLCLHWF